VDSVVGNGDVISRIALVPLDPSRIMSEENSAILTLSQRKILIQAWNTCRDDDVYRQVLYEFLHSSKDK